MINFYYYQDTRPKGILKKTNVASVPCLPSRRLSFFKKINNGRFGRSEITFQSKQAKKDDLPEVVSNILRRKSRSELMKLSVADFSIDQVKEGFRPSASNLYASEIRRIERNEHEWHLSQLKCYESDFTAKKFHQMSECDQWIVEFEAKGLIEPTVWKQSSGLFSQSVEDWHQVSYKQSSIPVSDVYRNRETLMRITGRAFEEFVSNHRNSNQTFRSFLKSYYREKYESSIGALTPSFSGLQFENEAPNPRSKWSVLWDLCKRCVATVTGWSNERQSAHRAWKEMYPVDYEIKRRQSVHMG